MKKWTWIIVILVVIGIVAGLYALSAATNVIEVDDASPLEIKDSMLTMDSETKAEFEKQTEAMRDVILESSDSMPGDAQLISQGNFEARAHSVEGKAILIEQDGEKILRFEDFETINGPNLHIYLSTELGNSDFVDLGKIKATKGNVNYEIPSSVDTSKYTKVLVWCVPFGIIFSYADLN